MGGALDWESGELASILGSAFNLLRDLGQVTHFFVPLVPLLLLVYSDWKLFNTGTAS